MVIYEVNLTMDPGVAPEIEAWLPGHVAELLEIDGFERAEWFDVGPDEEGRARFSLRYHITSQEHLDRYFEHDAERMRADGIKRFGGQFTATRRVLTPVQSFPG